MLNCHSLVLLFVVTLCLKTADAQVNVTISCVSCTSYIMSIGNATAGTPMSCPVGTVCAATNTSAAICAASNPCDGVVCDRYAVFPSMTSCQEYHVCRYVRGYASFVVSTYTCPGTSTFDINTSKCTLSPSAVCYSANIG